MRGTKTYPPSAFMAGPHAAAIVARDRNASRSEPQMDAPVRLRLPCDRQCTVPIFQRRQSIQVIDVENHCTRCEPRSHREIALKVTAEPSFHGRPIGRGIRETAKRRRFLLAVDAWKNRKAGG